MYGLYLSCSRRNEISQNTIMGSYIGIYLYSHYIYPGCGETSMSSNEIFNNTYSGNNRDIVLVHRSKPEEGGGEDPVVGIAILIVGGIFLLTAVGAFLGWALGKLGDARKSK